MNKRGDFDLAVWWVTTIGIVICLGFVAGIMIYFLKGALDSEDSTRIDPVNNEDE